MTNVVLPDGLEYIGERCFKGCALASVRLPPLLKIIENVTFYECKNLRTVNFPDGLEKIGQDVFAKTSLENIELPTSLRTIS